MRIRALRLSRSRVFRAGRGGRLPFVGDETEREQPSLELPKLGLRRRKRKQDSGGSSTESAPEQVDTAPLTPLAPELVEVPEAPAPPPTPVSGGSSTESAAERVDTPPPPDELASEPDVAPEPQRRKERPIRVRPQKPGGMLATVVVGLVVGLGIVGLTYASLQGCEQVQGTTSCGQTGYLLLIAILVVMVVVGTLLLRLARVAEAGATSFLAVGLASVLALLTLVDHLTDTSMVVVIPLLSAACYAAAHWVTRTFVDAA
jgi:hypothetical protein